MLAMPELNAFWENSPSYDLSNCCPLCFLFFRLQLAAQSSSFSFNLCIFILQARSKKEAAARGGGRGEPAYYS